MNQPGEQCDGGDLGGASCQSLGFSGGSLSCTGSCTFDTSACTTAPVSCAGAGASCAGTSCCVGYICCAGSLVCATSCDGGGGGNIAPTATITSPADGASFATGSTIVVSADASDSDGSVARVDFFANGGLLSSDTSSPYSHTSTNTPQGSYALVAKAVDNLGAEGSSGTVTITVSCACTEWVNGPCGAGGCAINQRLQARICTPSACLFENRCVTDATCSVCGNGVVEGSEQCDNGASNGACPAACSASCTINSCNNPPFGSVDYPNGNTLRGTITSLGWALDQETQVQSVTVKFRGPTNNDYAVSNVCVQRSDVCNAYSGGSSYPACSGDRCKAGWTASVDTLALQPGSYQVSATACDTAGSCGDLGPTRSATVDQCFGVTCNSPPSPTCSGTAARNVYNSPGTCNSANGACSYTFSMQVCPDGQVCSNGQCVNPCGGVVCNSPPASFCSGPNTLVNYTSPGACDTGTGQCQYSSTSITCTTPRSICLNGNTLRSYISSCVSGACTASPADTNCPYGCSSGACLGNIAPNLIDTALSASFVKIGNMVTVTSTGSDPNGEQVRLVCGTSSGGNDLCTSGYAVSNPSCGFGSPWDDSASHAVHCYLEDNGLPALRSSVLSKTLNGDNIAPAVSVSANPSSAVMPTGTLLAITATAGDSGSGLASVDIVIDGSVVRTCATSPCTHSYTPAYGSHTYYANAADNVGNIATTPQNTFLVNNAPAVSPISYTGSCISGGTITLNCDAADANQAANTLNVAAWAGQCAGADCFNTRSWATGIGTTYLSNSAMNAPSGGGTFTRSIIISQPSGSAIAATCQATDALGGQSNWGDAYPICVVDGCQNPPTITVNSIIPDPARTGNVRINFTANRTMNDPTISVAIKPGSQAGGVTEYPATFVSKSGNTYIYDFTVLASYMNGIADARVSGSDTENNCPASKISQFTIDTVAPSTSVLCNGAVCGSGVYRPSATIALSCSDASSSCASTHYSINGGQQQLYNPVSPPVLSNTGTYNINYWSTDSAGNVEPAKNQIVQVYASAANEQALVRIVSLQPKTVLFGQKVNGNISCFLKNADTGLFTRMCNIDQNGIGIIVDRGTSKEKEYFSTLQITKSNFIVQNLVNMESDVIVAGQRYTITRHWRLPLDTRIFSSEVCVNMTDSDSGLSGEQCDNYTVSNSQLLPSVVFPDVANLIIPATVTGAPNFTKTMPINFQANVKIQTGLSTSDCTGVNCRVEYSFIPFENWDPVLNPPHVASWSGFANSYVPNAADVSSNYFACDQYRTLYVRAIKQGGADSGITADTQSDFFINCNIRITVNPYEKRLVLGAQPGTVFDVTIWNPKEGANRVFNLQSIVKDAYVLSWVGFQCPSGSTGCSVDTVNNDIVTLVVPQISFGTAQVFMPTAVRSGAFPVTFVATENGTQYSTLGTILIFVEGLDEFAAWQLAGLFLLAVGIFAYSRFDITGRKYRTRK